MNGLEAWGLRGDLTNTHNRKKQKTTYALSQRALNLAGSCEQCDEPASSVKDMNNSATVSFTEFNKKGVLTFYYFLLSWTIHPV